MKRTRIILLVILVAAISGMSYYIVNKVGKATEEYQKRTSLPEFTFNRFDGRPYTRDSIPAAKPLVLMLFDPDCEHCKEELKNIKDSFAAFIGTELLLVSAADRSRVIPFTKMEGFDTLPHVEVLLTDAISFEASFGSVKTPSTFFYGPDGTLREDFYGKVQPEGLLKGLELIKQ